MCAWNEKMLRLFGILAVVGLCVPWSFAQSSGYVIDDGSTVAVSNVWDLTQTVQDLRVGATNDGSGLLIMPAGSVTNRSGVVGRDAGSDGNDITVQGGNWYSSSLVEVGRGGSSNTVSVTAGGEAASLGLAVGVESGADGNDVTVNGASSSWNSADEIHVGRAGSGNTMHVQDGAAVYATTALVGRDGGAIDNRVVVDGAATTWDNNGSFEVGRAGSENMLVVTNGATLSNDSGYIGRDLGADNNQVLVTGAGSAWDNDQYLRVGYGGSDNALTVEQGASVMSAGLDVGLQSGSTNNRVVLREADSSLESTERVAVGYMGNNNSLRIENGASASLNGLYVGHQEDGDQNLVVVTGTGSIITNTGNTYIGNEGSGNRLEITNQGEILGHETYLGVEQGADNNTAVVQGSGTFWNNDGIMVVGGKGSTNRLEASDGALVEVNGLTVGSGVQSTSNEVVLNGGRLQSHNTVVIGDNGVGNTLWVTNRASIDASAAIIGQGATASDNTVVVNRGSLGVVNALQVGGANQNNRLIVSDGGSVDAKDIELGYRSGAANHSILVDHSRLVAAETLTVGLYGTNHILRAKNGATISGNTVAVGGTAASSNNVMDVSGLGTQVLANNQLIVGDQGNHNQFLLRDDAVVTNAYGYTIVGRQETAHNNSALITNGTVRSQFGVIVGQGGSDNTMVVRGDSTVHGGMLAVGHGATASGNILSASGSNVLLKSNTQIWAGLNGTSNEIQLSEGAQLKGLELGIGSNAGADSNRVAVTDAGSRIDLLGTVSVGENGVGNRLDVLSSAELEAHELVVGDLAGADRNSVVVDQSTMVLDGAGNMVLGGAGASNRIDAVGSVVTQQGDLLMGRDASGTDNVLTLSDTSWTAQGDVTIGKQGGSNSLLVTNEATLVSMNGTVGEASGENVAQVTGLNGTWNLSGLLTVGGAGNDNGVQVDSGASLSAVNATVGAAADSNRIQVMDASQFVVSDQLLVGDEGVSNELDITKGSAASADSLMIGRGVAGNMNDVLLSDAGSSLVVTQGVVVGLAGADNTLDILGGGTAEAGSLAVGVNSDLNSVLAQGTGTMFTVHGDTVVGDAGSQNNLMVNQGAVVRNNEGTIGAQAGSYSNSVSVQGVGSTWAVAGDLGVGEAGSENKLFAEQGATVTSMDLTIGGASTAMKNATVVRDAGSTLSVDGTLSVGEAGTDNAMLIEDGALVDASDTVVGAQANADMNQLTVRGAGTKLDAGRLLVVGQEGAENQLVLLAGAQVESDDSVIGEGLNAADNIAVISGTGTTWNAGSSLVIGSRGSGNSMQLGAAATVANIDATVGQYEDASYNMVQVAGGVWTNERALVVGESGDNNSVTLSSGATMYSAIGTIGEELGATSNQVTVTDAGTVWNNTNPLLIGSGGTKRSLVVGDGGANSRLDILNGGRVENSVGYIGLENSASNSVVLVDGAGSSFNSSGDLFVGHRGSDVLLQVTGGGMVRSDSGYVGMLEVGDNNTAIVSGGTWSNAAHLAVGYEGAKNLLWVDDAGMVYSRDGVIGEIVNADENTVILTGAGSQWRNEQELIVGRGSSENLLVVSNGASLVSADLRVGYESSAMRNIVLVTGTGSEVQLSDSLHVGRDGKSSAVLIEDGGRVEAANASVGLNSDENRIVLTDAGSSLELTGDLLVGEGSDENNIDVLAGAVVEVDNLRVGKLASAELNKVLVDGAGSVVTVRDTLYVGDEGSLSGLVVARGGTVVSADGAVGFATGSSSNRVVVSDVGTSWANSGGLTVGDSGAENSLRIEEGAELSSDRLVLGAKVGAEANQIIAQSGSTVYTERVVVGEQGDRNDVLVTEKGTVWSNGADFVVGSMGAGNELVVSNGALLQGDRLVIGDQAINNTVTVSNGAVEMDRTMLGESAGSQDNRLVLESSTFLNQSDLTVGGSGRGNTVEVRTQALLENHDATLGVEGGADGNTINVNGGRWDSRGVVYVGFASDANNVTVSNMGRVTSDRMELGWLASSSSNRVALSGSGSSLEVNDLLSVGVSGFENLLSIDDGAEVIAGRGVIGSHADSDGNEATVTGVGTTFELDGNLIVGNEGSDNQLKVLQGAALTSSNSFVGALAASQMNEVLIDGSTWTNHDQLHVGYSGMENLLSVTNRSSVQSRRLVLGRNGGADRNRVLIDDGSTLDITEDLVIGREGNANELLLQGGSTLMAGDVYLGSMGGVNNRLTLVDSTATVGALMNESQSTLRVSEGATLSTTEYMQDATSRLEVNVVTNDLSDPLATRVSVAGTAEFEADASIYLKTTVGLLDPYAFYTNTIVAANQLIVGSVTNATTADLDQLDAVGELMHVSFAVENQDIQAHFRRNRIATAAGFDPGSSWERLADEIDASGLDRNAIAIQQIQLLNGMSGSEMSRQIQQYYGRSMSTYRHQQSLAQGLQTIQNRSFRSYAKGKSVVPSEGVSGPMADERETQVWVQGYGSVGVKSGAGVNEDFDDRIGGTVFGLEQQYGALTMGVGGGFARSWIDQDNNDSSEADTLYGVVYGSVEKEDWLVDLGFAGGRHDIEMQSGTAFDVSSDLRAQNYLASLGVSRLVSVNKEIDWFPKVGLNTGYYLQEGYEERSSLALTRAIPEYDRWNIQSQLGGMVAWSGRPKTGVQRVANLKLYWLHEFNDEDDELTYQLPATGGTHTLMISGPEQDLIQLGTGLGIERENGLGVAVDADLYLGDEYQSATISGRLTYEF